MLRSLFLVLLGGSYGLLAAAGVFTVLVAVGLVPRYAGMTHTANRVFLYEEMIVLGTVFGAFISLFPEYGQLGAFLQRQGFHALSEGLGCFLQVAFGLFSGMFIGCLALAIAEVLDSIPIFARRISFRHGLGLVVVSMAAGKLCGSLVYFWQGLHRVVK